MRRAFSTVAVVAALTLACERPTAAQWMPPAATSPARTVSYGSPWMVSPTAAVAPVPTAYAAHLGDEPAVPAGPSEAPAVSPPTVEYGSFEGYGEPMECMGGRRFCRCRRCRSALALDQVFCGLEYMFWYNKGIALPPLVTTSPQGTLQAQAGRLPGAAIVFGGGDIDDDQQSGARLTFGWWTDESRSLAVAAKMYGVEGGAERFGLSAAGNPIIARPFFNADPIVNAEDALLISFPGLVAGSVNATAANDVLGTEVYLRTLLDHGYNYRIDFLTGWQYSRIDSDLSISSDHTRGANRFVFNDVFDVENQFNAGTLGLYGELYHRYLTFSAMGKIGIGGMNQQVLVTGNNSVIAGGTVTTAGGLLTQPTNIGTYERNVFAVSPEVNVKLNCALTENISVSIGYTFLYWNRVAFAGDQIDRVVNATQLNGGALAGPARPRFGFNDTDFWVQSLDFGLNFNY